MLWHNDYEFYEVRYANQVEGLDYTKSIQMVTLSVLLESANVSNIPKNRVLAKTQATDYGPKNKPKWNNVIHRH